MDSSISNTTDRLHSLLQTYFNGVAMVALSYGANKWAREHRHTPNGKLWLAVISITAFTRNCILSRVPRLLRRQWVRSRLDWDLVMLILHSLNLAYIHGLSIQALLS